VRGEIYYDSKGGTWSKNTYSFGATFPIRKRLELGLLLAEEHGRW